MDLETLQNTPAWQWPEDVARKTILKTLADPQASESDRLTAAYLAGNLIVMNDDVARTLLAIVGNSAESEELRGRAAISLGPALEEAQIEEIGTEFSSPEDITVSESMYDEIKDALPKLFADQGIPKYVRRKILEASVRACEDWHASAIRTAYASGDRDWVLTAVFSMQYVDGFDDQIIDALNSEDSDVHYEAVRAAGNWEIDEAWPHVVALVQNHATPKPLLLAAIEAVGNIRPKEAGAVLVDLTDSADEEIAAAANEAMGLPPEISDEEAGGEEAEDEEDGDGSEGGADEWVN